MNNNYSSNNHSEQFPDVEVILSKLDESVQSLGTRDFNSVAENWVGGLVNETDAHPWEMVRAGFCLGAGLTALNSHHLGSAATHIIKLITWKALSSMDHETTNTGAQQNAT